MVFKARHRRLISIDGQQPRFFKMESITPKVGLVSPLDKPDMKKFLKPTKHASYSKKKNQKIH